MMKTKITLLVILGILSVLSPFFFIGLVLGILPGIILMLAPTAFVYYAGAVALGFALKYLRIPFPATVALVVLIGLGCWASHQLNMPIKQTVDEYAQLDMPLEGAFQVPKTIAIYSKYYERHKGSCNEICQKLLYNKAAEKILIIEDPSIVQNNPEQMVVSYEIVQDENCTYDNVTSKTGGNMASANLKSRIAAGECLKKINAKLSEAGAIFFHDKINMNDGYQKYENLKRRVIFVNYIELLKNVSGSFEKIYRYSKISAQPFAYPLSWGPILGGSGGDMSLNQGYFHTTMTVNNPGSSYYDPIKEFQTQMDQIFGSALKEVEAVDINPLIKKALNSKGQKIAGHSLVGQFLGDICINKKTPTDEDMQLVIEALKDDRVDNWHCLNGFSQRWYKAHNSLPEEYVRELANKVIRNKGNSVASNAIRFLPDGEAAVIYQELKQISKNSNMSGISYGAVIRLSDAGAVAVPEYIQILKTHNLDAAVGAMIGLCRLGKDALPAREMLYRMIDNARFTSKIGGSAVDAFIEMGLQDELLEKYKFNQEILKDIEDAIKQKERSNKKGRPFCGRRIM